MRERILKDGSVIWQLKTPRSCFRNLVLGWSAIAICFFWLFWRTTDPIFLYLPGLALFLKSYTHCNVDRENLEFIKYSPLLRRIESIVRLNNREISGLEMESGRRKYYLELKVFLKDGEIREYLITDEFDIPKFLEEAFQDLGIPFRKDAPWIGYVGRKYIFTFDSKQEADN